MLSETSTGLGPRMRALRESMGLSLRELADKTGVSAPMLSQVERGETSPTVNLAQRIANGFGLSLSSFIRLDEEPRVAVLTSAAQPTRAHGGHLVTELNPPSERTIVSRHRLAPSAATAEDGDPPLHAAGSRETVVVESGQIVFEIGSDEYKLKAGDAVTFDADLAHRFRNPGRTDAVFTAVVSAPVRG